MRSDDVSYVIEPPRRVRVAIPGYNPTGILGKIHAAFEKKRQKQLTKQRRTNEQASRSNSQSLDEAEGEVLALNEALLLHAEVPHHHEAAETLQDEPLPFEADSGCATGGFDLPWHETPEGAE